MEVLLGRQTGNPAVRKTGSRFGCRAKSRVWCRTESRVGCRTVNCVKHRTRKPSLAEFRKRGSHEAGSRVCRWTGNADSGGGPEVEQSVVYRAFCCGRSPPAVNPSRRAVAGYSTMSQGGTYRVGGADDTRMSVFVQASPTGRQRVGGRASAANFLNTTV